MNHNVLKSVVRDFTPPVFTKALNQLRGRGKDNTTNSEMSSHTDFAHELQRLSALPRRVPTLMQRQFFMYMITFLKREVVSLLLH